MSARGSYQDREQGQTAHGESLAQKLCRPHLALALASFAACSDVEPLNLAPLDPDDVDADHVPNAADNCPEKYNPDQHDEDGDGFGDACDVCPATFDDQADFGEAASFGIGDHVGDACDPRPTRDGDRLAQLDTFVEDSSAEYAGDGWRIGADVARAVGPARWEYQRALEGDGLLARIEVPLLVWLGDGLVEVSVNGDGVEAGATCTLVHAIGGPDLLIAREVGGAMAMTEVPEVEAPFTLGAWRTIDFVRDARLRCFLGDVTLDLPVDDSIPKGTVGFASTGAITDVDSLAVYTFPINPCLQVPPTDGPSPLRHACDGAMLP